MPRLHPHKLDGALWIDIDPGVKKDIRKAWKSDFWGPWWNLGMVPENKTDAWWASFVQKYYWDDDHEAAVSFAWTKHCPSSISSRISQRKTSGVKPDFISTNDWKLMLQTWGTAKCVSRSKTNSKNRKSNKHGVGMHIHNAGAKGFGQIGHEMTVATGGIRPPITEIVRKTHTKKDGTYGDKHGG